jgi:NAD(P)H dehydrogenase (quinone)
MILVTGAAGKTGRAVIATLAAKGASVRAFVRRAEAGAALRGIGAQDIALGSLDDRAALRRAVDGCRAIYFIAPNVDAGETRYAAALIDAAKRAGVAHFVYHSVLHPQIEAMPHHWAKLRVEEMLVASGLAFTILQPAAYMQNILGALPRARSDRIYVTPYPVTTRISLVDLADVAQVAARVLTEPGHEGATYQLVGSPAFSQVEVAAALTSVMGYAVWARAQTVEDWEAGVRASGLDDDARETLARMFRAYAQQGLVGNANVLRLLLEREPTSLKAMLKRSLKEA